MLFLQKPSLKFDGAISTHALDHYAVGLRINLQSWTLLLLLLQRFLNMKFVIIMNLPRLIVLQEFHGVVFEEDVIIRQLLERKLLHFAAGIQDTLILPLIPLLLRQHLKEIRPAAFFFRCDGRWLLLAAEGGVGQRLGRQSVPLITCVLLRRHYRRLQMNIQLRAHRSNQIIIFTWNNLVFWQFLLVNCPSQIIRT